MLRNTPLVANFSEVPTDAFDLVGGKGINLVKMSRAFLPVPPGFIVTTSGYREFIDSTPSISYLIEEIMSGLNVNNAEELEAAGIRLRQLIMQVHMPEVLEAAIRTSYRSLGGFVAVRSSATAEDLPEQSFAGQQLTLLNVSGEENVVHAVQECFASLWTDRAIFYRATNGIHQRVEMAVVVQSMIQAEVAGVMMTADPQTSDLGVVLIEAGYGLGEYVVGGNITPDSYTVKKESLSVDIEKTIISPQREMLVKNVTGAGPKNVSVPVPEHLVKSQKLSDDQVVDLAQIGIVIENFYGSPQDVEWAFSDRFYIVQSRPLTTLHQQSEVKEEAPPEETAQLLASGQGASSGVGVGRVRILRNHFDNHLVEPGDIMVTSMTTPDFVPAMKRAAAIVTERGGRTCHAAIVSRELGVPCIIGASEALSLPSDEIVTVDGYHGKVFAGRAEATIAWHERYQQRLAKETSAMESVRTHTKLLLILADPDQAAQIAASNVDGVGLLREELILARIGKHPRQFIAEGNAEEFISQLENGIGTFCKAFGNRPVIVRCTDFKTNEYSGLAGAENFEPIVRLYDAEGHPHLVSREENPMMGFRGALRYVVDRESFALEVEAIKRVHAKHPNLQVMLPFVRTPEELAAVVGLMESLGLRREGLQLGMMVEVPSNVIELPEFIQAGKLDFVSIGSNDLTQLALGADRDNPVISSFYDERNRTVMRLIEQTIRVAHQHRVRVGICGQAPSDWPEITKSLVEWEIDSISVNPDVVAKTRRIIKEAEDKLLY
jgi:pyruvate,water dikinase